jgi:hypothetical protein
VPLWAALRSAGRKVAAATWPGADGSDVTLPGTPGLPIVQRASPARQADYTVPFGASGGIGAEGYALTSADFADDDGAVAAQLVAAGKRFYGSVKVSRPLGVTLAGAPSTTFYCARESVPSAPCGAASASRTLPFTLRAAAIDTTDDARVNYDTLAVFNADAAHPQIAPGPFAAPATGPAYARAGRGSARFHLAGTGNAVGTAFFVSHLAPDLSQARFARYALTHIPRNPAVAGDVDDANRNVGFWSQQPDFRILQRLSPGFGAFSADELEAIYLDQVRTFTRYQTQLALHAIARNRDADLVMTYVEQPDGSGHQFTLTDPRQPSDPGDQRSVGERGVPPGATGQDPRVRERYARHLADAYRHADAAVDAIVRCVGLDAGGRPRSDVIVVSDHGMAPFHSAVSLRGLLSAGGMNEAELARLRLQTSGPSANVYVDLAGREHGGKVDASEYPALQAKVAAILRAAVDANAFYNPAAGRLFSVVVERPTGCGAIGLCTDAHIGQDFGDVFALLGEGYNFDGAQSPAVPRLLDPASAASIYSVPGFYGAHGYDASLPSMSAMLIAAGPSIRSGVTVPAVRNIDIAPTILHILGVAPPATVDGVALTELLRSD